MATQKIPSTAAEKPPSESHPTQPSAKKPSPESHQTQLSAKKIPPEPHHQTQSSAKKSLTKRIGKYTIIGIILTIFNFLVYTFVAQVIIKNNDLLWLASAISYFLATFLAYFLHSRITWRERHPTKFGVVMFFFWNLLTALVISPLATKLFGLVTPLYEFAYNISSNLHLPFDYDFIESTGIFCLATLVTMILNYLCYDKLVFGTNPPHRHKSP